MKKLILFVLAAALLSTVPTTSKAQDPAPVSFDYFYTTLADSGDWADIPEFGLCWHPRSVDEDWAPYSDGYWASTDAGWTWVSYESWGDITYHYGRWTNIPDQGWFWVPGYEWAPAWVSWRFSDAYVGWAPLPPQATWVPETGFGSWVETQYVLPASAYNFCEIRHFGNPALRPVIFARSRNAYFIQSTVNITNIVINQTTNVICNPGPDFQKISQHVQRPIPTYHLRIENSANNGFHTKPSGGDLVVVAPRVVPSNTKPTGPRSPQGYKKVTPNLPPRIAPESAGKSDFSKLPPRVVDPADSSKRNSLIAPRSRQEQEAMEIRREQELNAEQKIQRQREEQARQVRQQSDDAERSQRIQRQQAEQEQIMRRQREEQERQSQAIQRQQAEQAQSQRIQQERQAQQQSEAAERSQRIQRQQAEQEQIMRRQREEQERQAQADQRRQAAMQEQARHQQQQAELQRQRQEQEARRNVQPPTPTTKTQDDRRKKDSDR